MPGLHGVLMKKPKKNKTGEKTVLGPVATVFSSVDTGSWRIVRPLVDGFLCIRCGQCMTFCPTNVIEVHPKEAGEDVKPVEIDWRYCKGCGICADVCLKECIKMVDEEGEK